MHIPSSTYRLQFNKDFTFRDALSMVDYLHDLGISTIYASPIFAAVPGSVHGYDVTDPRHINPEIGTEAELEQLAAKLREYNMTWLQDIVPNHMAFNSNNRMLWDVLKKGKSSAFADFFDIDWDHPDPELNGKLLVPFLGKNLKECLQSGDLTLSEQNGNYFIQYFDNRYPINAKTDLKKNIEEIVNLQYYRLDYWQRADKDINYRRFFTVNSLICLAMEKQPVFHEYHKYIAELYCKNLIQGVRIDHIDGLKDPKQYVDRLRWLLGRECYIIAEKILHAEEEIPEDWDLQGTSGYEFLSMVNQLLTDRKGARNLLQFYKDQIGDPVEYQALVYQNKLAILTGHMSGELDNLLRLLLSQELLKAEKQDDKKLKDALASFMAAFPVYRIYPDEFPLPSVEEVDKAHALAIAKNPTLEKELSFIRNLFAPGHSTAEDRQKLQFIQRLMQFTGPLAAKGVEDTTFYVFDPLISHNEVGDSPDTLGISVNTFHRKMQLRQEQVPFSLNATSTHDTKRGEDARLRIDLLSEIPEEWAACVQEWMKLNSSLRDRDDDGLEIPSKNEEYFIYQSLVGGFPENMVCDENFIGRVKEYLVKAFREAKQRTNWSEPNENFEKAIGKFVDRILEDAHGFISSFKSFMKRVIPVAEIYSLAQTLIKITAPGIPDFYQGSELWDLSYVDPDNRRDVDYTIRRKMLAGELEPSRKIVMIQKALQFRKNHNDVFLHGKYIPVMIPGMERALLAFVRTFKGIFVLTIVPLGVAIKREEIIEVKIPLPEGAGEIWKNELTSEFIHAENNQLTLHLHFEKMPVAILSTGLKVD